jgi:AraC-like DNA-binding protein
MFGWWQIAALLGAAQGGIVALALATRRTARLPNRILAAAVLAFAIHLAAVAYYSAGWVDRWPHFFGVSQPVLFLFGPLIYLYAATASDRERRLRWSDLLHALPFVVMVLLSIPIFRMSGADKIALYAGIQQGQIPSVVMVTDPLKLLSGIGYAVVTLRLLQRHRRVIADNYSSVERLNLNWLQWLVFSGTAIWLLAVGFSLLEGVGVTSPINADLLIALSMTVLIYGIGYMGSRQPEIFRFTTAEFAIRTLRVADGVGSDDTVSNDKVSDDALPDDALSVDVASDTVVSDISVSTDALRRPNRSALTPRMAKQLTDKLLAAMENERPYRNENLTLADLATQLGTSPHRLSEVLNGSLNATFYDFVNGYRVREVQARLVGPEGAQRTYLALALDAGFASKSTFNAVFKKHTGMTPSEFRAAHTS